MLKLRHWNVLDTRGEAPALVYDLVVVLRDGEAQFLKVARVDDRVMMARMRVLPEQMSPRIIKHAEFHIKSIERQACVAVDVMELKENPR